MLDDLMCSTSGVPTRFACPMLLDGSELDTFNRIFTTMTAIPTEAADFITFLVKPTQRTMCMIHMVASAQTVS